MTRRKASSEPPWSGWALIIARLRAVFSASASAPGAIDSSRRAASIVNLPASLTRADPPHSPRGRRGVRDRRSAVYDESMSRKDLIPASPAEADYLKTVEGPPIPEGADPFA